MRWFMRLAKGLVRIVFGTIVKVLRLLLRPFAQPLTTLNFTLYTYHLLKDVSADIYQAHDSQSLAAAFFLAKHHKAGFAYDAVEIATERSATQQKGKISTITGKFLGRFWEGFFIKKANLIITPTPVIADVLRTRYRVTPHLIMNCTWYRHLKELCLPQEKSLSALLPHAEGRKILFYSGAISAANGIDYLILCLRQLPEEISLVLMGPMQPKYKDQCEELISAENVAHRVFILPPVTPHLVPCYASSADVGIVAYQAGSLNNYATLPNKFFEYVMARLPIAAPDFPALRKIITEEDIGHLFEPSNVQDMARAILEILEPNTYRRLKSNLEGAARKYSWENQARKLVDLYDRLVQKGDHEQGNPRTHPEPLQPPESSG
jgi:glycosyltransferase involved in cell wall biosynthesis